MRGAAGDFRTKCPSDVFRADPICRDIVWELRVA